MVESFRGLGVEAVPGVGAPFDPELHEAIMREESDDVPDGTVLREFRRGFRLGDKLLRAAMVQVRRPLSLMYLAQSPPKNPVWACQSHASSLPCAQASTRCVPGQQVTMCRHRRFLW